MQTKTQSFIEACTNTAIGFGISYASTFLIFPLVGFQSHAGTNLIITLYFTVISILRSYVVRRFFNREKKQRKAYEYFDYKLYCFECEIDMPALEDEFNNLYCSNCGLKH